MQQGSLAPMWRLLLQLRQYYPIIFIYSVCISVLTLATPISVQSLVNTISFGPYFQPIFILSLILLALLVVLGVIKCLQFLVVEYLQRKLYAKITAIIGQAYQLREVEEDYLIDEKANRYFDIILIYKNLAFVLTEGVSIALQATIGLVLISLYHPFFIVFGILIVVAIIGPLYFFSRQALSSSVEESTSKYEVADFLKSVASRSEDYSDPKTFEVKINRQIGDFLKNRSRHFRTLYMQNIIYVSLYAGLNALLLALGGYLVVSNQLTVGQLVAAEIVVNAMLTHFLYAGKYLEAFYDMYAAIIKVYPFLEHLDRQQKDVQAQSDGFEDEPSIFETLFSRLPAVEQVSEPKNYRRIIKRFAFVTIAVLFLFAVVPWQQFSRSQGRLVALNPNDRVQTITAPVEGIVEEWLVQDGQRVKKGSAIVRVVDNDPQYLIRLESKRDAAVARFEAAKEASDTGRLNFHRQEKLVQQGLSSPKEFEQAKIRYKKLLAEEAASAAELAKAEVDLSRQQQQDVVAPRDGQIRRILLGSGTTKVKEGEALVEFVPDSKQDAVELFVDGNDLPLVYPGRKVRLQFEGWPAVQLTGWPSVAIGSFGGVVSVVDPSVGQDGTFRVLVQPDPEDPMSWPDQKILRQGTRVLGIINLDRVTIGYELWRQVNGFPKSMDKAPDQLYGVEKK